MEKHHSTKIRCATGISLQDFFHAPAMKNRTGSSISLENTVWCDDEEPILHPYPMNKGTDQQKINITVSDTHIMIVKGVLRVRHFRG